MRDFLRRRFSREEVVGLSFTLSFLTCAALAVALGWMAHDIRAEHDHPGSFDLSIRQAMIARRSPELTQAMLAATFTGSHGFLLVATPVVAAAIWIIRRHHVSALLFTGSVVGGFLLSAIMKIAVARARPERWDAIVRESTFSFPSGHTVMATVFFGGLAAVVFHRTARIAPRVLAAAGAGAMVLAVAASRIYLGAHWPTDTLAGMLTGLVWVVAFDATTEAMERARGKRMAAP